jgi:hypothetical protein
LAAHDAKPAFVTFTGIDDAALVKGIVELGQRYPIEWGVLIDRDKAGSPLFPDARQIDRFRSAGVRLCAHLCGSYAREIALGLEPPLNLAGFSRIQVNHGRDGADDKVVNAVGRYAARQGVRGVLQCNGPFPVRQTAVDWLYDVSFGEGVRPASYPPIRSAHPFCGISGGIAPDNVAGLVAERIELAGDYPYWIDMESGVRSDGRFDLDKCRAVCEAVFGKGRPSA